MAENEQNVEKASDEMENTSLTENASENIECTAGIISESRQDHLNDDSLKESIQKSEQNEILEKAAKPDIQEEEVAQIDKEVTALISSNVAEPIEEPSVKEVILNKPDESPELILDDATDKKEVAVGETPVPDIQTGNVDDIPVAQSTENDIEPAVNEQAESDTQESQKDTNESQLEAEIPSTSGEKSPAKRKLSDTPEDIINLLKNLSPEKLLEIKSKVLEITDKPEVIENKKQKVEEEPVKAEIKPEEVSEKDKNEVASSDVICLDDSDEESNDTKIAPANEDSSGAAQEQQSQAIDEIKKTDDVPEEIKADEHSHLNGDSPRLNLKECINPECPKHKEDEYLESPSFVLSMYYITRKPNKIQWVCKTCYEEAIETYEKLCSKFLSNEPWMDVKIPKKQDLVEIIDSDEEDEINETAEQRESNMIIFNEQVEMEVEEILTSLSAKIDIKMQLEQEYELIESKIDKNDKLLGEMNQELIQLERKSYKMYDELYAFNRPKIQRRPSLSIDVEIIPEPITRVVAEKSQPDVSITPVVRQSPGLQQKNLPFPAQDQEKICYAIRQRGVQMPHWMPCRILEEISHPEGKKFKVQFCDNLPNSLTVLSGKEISVSNFCEKLEIGARVIALFPRSVARNKQQGPHPKRFLPGVIGEKLTQYNKRRYLVFCDYGQVRYCEAKEVRAIQESSENVWDDVHPNLRQFIRDYLESKTNRSRALLNVRVNTQILTERAGNWRKTIVQEIDCSLVKVYFTAEHVSEWLYRGSKRLYTMYQQTQRVSNNTFQRRTDPGAFSYITIDDDENNISESSTETKRNIAKKSTAKPQQPQVQAPAIPSAKQPIILNDSFIYMDDPAIVAKVRHFTPKAGICAKRYMQHDCSPSCITPLKNDLSSFSPLSKPLLSCWERQIVRQKNFRHVVYKAPCGRRLRNMNEVFIYLGITKCALNVDNFDFDPSTAVLASYHVDKTLCPLFIDDITGGKEGMKVSCINAFDNQRPPPLEYSAHRIPMNGVNINTDPEFMSCCDCTDECVDKSKCACFQLTIRGAKYKNLMEEDEENISYLWKRLLSVVPTGIYECNSRCKCSSRCLNKVVQQPVRVKMQLYRTKARGWGLQSLHDIPKGTFICIYAGNLYTEKDANALCQGLDHGDEYFAELDLIENAENRKEGYESGIVYHDESDEKDSDSDYDDKNDSHDYEDGDFVAKSKATGGKREIVTRSSKTTHTDDSKKSSASSTPQRQNSDSSDDDEMVSMVPTENNTGSLGYPEGMRIPFRKLYGPKEKVYIMDAKRCGNVGRYFNHSCDPNLFVQSVFVDTHDLRFPWIAFFAQRHIKAGEELTWNYNYEVGSVPSKVLYCKCGSKNCRGRIL